MRTIDIIRRAARSLSNAKIRTVLTSLAIGVGAFTLTIALAAGEGARQYTDTLLSSNIDPQILAITKDPSFFQGGITQPREYQSDVDLFSRPNGVSVSLLSQKDIDKIASTENIVSVRPTYSITAKYITRENSKKYTVDVESYDSGVTQEVIAGNLPPLRSTINNNQIVLPEVYVSKLEFKDAADAIGKKVTLHQERESAPTAAELQAALAQGADAVTRLTTKQVNDVTLDVVAVTGRSATAIQASNNVQVSQDIAKEMSDFTNKGTPGFEKYLIVAASVKDGVDPASVKEVLLKEGYGVQTAKDLQSLLFTIVNILQGIVFGFGILALITSVFGIINTQYISVLERTREIGLMKALGMRGRHVSRLFQFEAAWIGFLGGTLGAIIALVSGTIMNPYITKWLSLGDGNYLLVFQPIPIVLLVVSLTVIAMLSGVLPARKAAKLDPIEALRTE